MPNCWCPSCGGRVPHFVPSAQPRYNPTVPKSAIIEEDKISERAIELADARRSDIITHTHVSIGKLLNQDRY